MEKSHHPSSKEIKFYSNHNEDLLQELHGIMNLLDHALAYLQPATRIFADIYIEQENKKLNVMKAASVIEVEGDKMKTTDFIMEFDELLASIIDKISSTAKNSVKLGLYLNAAIEEMKQIETITAKNSNKTPLIEQITESLATCQKVLKEVATLDADEISDVQDRLGILLQAFSRRNMQLLQMTGNPPMSTKRMDEALMDVAADLKSTSLARFMLEKLIGKISGKEVA